MESFRKFFRQLSKRKFRKTKFAEKNQCNNINKSERRSSFNGAVACSLETVHEEEESSGIESQMIRWILNQDY